MFSSVVATAFNSLTLNHACKRIHKQAKHALRISTPLCWPMCLYADARKSHK